MRVLLFTVLFSLSSLTLYAQSNELQKDNITWTSQSKNSGESMPCGGGDIGLNVWVENGDLLFYVARSGTYDENNTLLKLGRVRIKMSPNPFASGDFTQTLDLQSGAVTITAGNKNLSSRIKIWADVFKPIIQISVETSKPVKVSAGYETWRYRDRITTGLENNQNSYKFSPQGEIRTRHDEINYKDQSVEFYHKNDNAASVFNLTVKQQGLESVKDQLYNPQYNLVFGGKLTGKNMLPDSNYTGVYLNTDFKGWRLTSKSPVKKQVVTLVLSTSHEGDVQKWENELDKIVKSVTKTDQQQTLDWWASFWNRSFIHVEPESIDHQSAAWQSGRNYQLFRYMLACNAFGSFPTKFNGGLFTVDPILTDTSFHFTPDFRNWAGGTFTAQNQRLVYYPMIKNGDFDLLKPQLDFYLNILKTGQLATQLYWHHAGARFPEQIDNYGLSNPAEYGWKRRPGMDPGVDDNAWLEYHWDTVLEFCLMMLQEQQYGDIDIEQYIPFIQSCTDFFDIHYQYLAAIRGAKSLDADGHLIMYPGSGAETFKMAYNSTATITGLSTVLKMMLALPSRYLNTQQRSHIDSMISRIPPIAFRQQEGHTTISPAWVWQRINNVESPQLYTVYPYGTYGLHQPGLDTALNTWNYDKDVIRFRSYIGWKQDNIWAARLGLTDEAARLTFLKMKDSGRRFPAFWGPGFDWNPDHNWGGSGMIGMQEMLLQAIDNKIYLLPVWPKNTDVHFKLYAPGKTVVECSVKNNKVESLKVTPAERLKDVVLPDWVGK